MPLHTAYVEAQAGVATGAPYAQVEAGAHLRPGLGAYGLAQWQRSAWVVGAGLRYEVHW